MLALALLVSQLQVRYEVSEFANAVYHLSCLTGRVACSNGVYTRVWNEGLGLTREDGARLERWSQVFDRAEKAAGQARGAALLPNYPSFYPGLRVRQELLAAALDGGSPERFRQLAEPMVGAADAAALEEVTRQTVERLHGWYVANAPAVERRRQEVEARGRANGSAEMIAGMARFVRAEFGFREVWVHVLPSPAPKQNDASATALRNHAFLEFTEPMPVDGAASIVAHEVTHALYDSASSGDHGKLIGQFAAVRHPAAAAMYGLLNEALATGVQRLLSGGKDERDEDVYRHPYIPRAGRAVMPVLREALAGPATILDGFVRRYVAALEKEMGREALTPRFQLLAAGVLAGDRLKESRDAFVRAFHMVGSFSSEEEMRQYPGLPVVRLVTYDEAGAVLGGVREWKALTARRGFVYRLGGRRVSFVVAGRDEAGVRMAIEGLAKSEDRGRRGLVVSVE